MKSSFRDLLVWQKAMDLIDEIYRTVAEFPRHELFGLTSQLKRAATRIASDIAEGAGRWNLPDFRHFLRDARGSAYELETEILIAQRQGLLSAKRADELVLQCVAVEQLINGLIRYINKQIAVGQQSTVNRQRRPNSSMTRMNSPNK